MRYIFTDENFHLSTYKKFFRQDDADQESFPGLARRGKNGLPSRKLFDHGELRLVVLALIAERARHGYEIIKEIEDRVAGTYAPSPGVIYPTLVMLEELGHATVTEKNGKKSYTITSAGNVYLTANQGIVEAIMARMDAVNKSKADEQTPAIVRARENLRTALRLRLDRGPLTPKQIRAIAKIFDDAAVAVEQS